MPDFGIFVFHKIILVALSDLVRKTLSGLVRDKSKCVILEKNYDLMIDILAFRFSFLELHNLTFFNFCNFLVDVQSCNIIQFPDIIGIS